MLWLGLVMRESAWTFSNSVLVSWATAGRLVCWETVVVVMVGASLAGSLDAVGPNVSVSVVLEKSTNSVFTTNLGSPPKFIGSTSNGWTSEVSVAVSGVVRGDDSTDRPPGPMEIVVVVGGVLENCRVSSLTSCPSS